MAARGAQAGVDHAVASIAQLADRAAGSGITLGLEFCNRYETSR